MLKKFLAVNKLIIIKTKMNKPLILSPAIYPLLLTFLPFLNPRIKKANKLNINNIKLVIVELTPIKLNKLQIKINNIKNIT